MILIAAAANLRQLMRDRPLTIERVSKDRYGRTLAIVRAGGVDVGCAQIKARAAFYIRRWDDGGRERRCRR